MQNEIGAVVDLLTHPGFWSGLGIGLVVAALLLTAGLGKDRNTSGWALAFAATVGIGVWLQFDVDPIAYVFVGGLALVGLAGDVFLSQPDIRPGPVGAIGYWAAAFAATLMLMTLLPVGDILWANLTLPLVVAGSAAGIWLLSRSYAAEALGPMVAISVAGMWVTVPETDVITVLVGAAIPFGLATLPPMRARALVAGSLALAGSIAWVVFIEGTPRPWTVAAAWATLATLPLLGALVRLRTRNLNVYMLGLIHLLYVVAITRVADVTDSPVVVALSMCLLLCLATGALLVVPRVVEPAELRP